MYWLTEGIFRLKRNSDTKPAAFTARFKDKNLLDEFDEIAKKSKYTRNELLNLVVDKFVDEVEMVELDSAENLSLKENFIELENLLKRHINKEIKIARNKDEQGRENGFYQLLDFSISFNENTLLLKFKGQDEEDYNDVQIMTFDNIIDLACQKNNSLFRIWLYRPNSNWKFYLKY